ncbi:MAG: hypothetical protein ATN35_07845 [Epulopiscium sp. Nele67-Bin004]|nr:MAG: hypothetical protein ATN35_07845 [Epulopiscium sp. Nele67-Bin004]
MIILQDTNCMAGSADAKATIILDSYQSVIKLVDATLEQLTNSFIKVTMTTADESIAIAILPLISIVSVEFPYTGL